MHKDQWILFFISMLFSFSGLSAEIPEKGGVCSVSTLGSCGEGAVSISFRGNSFRIVNEDVPCWMTSYYLRGTFENHRPTPFLTATIVDLMNGDLYDKKTKIGEFVFQNSRVKNSEPIAMLKLQTHRASSDRYHLTCVLNDLPLICEEKCMQEGFDFAVCTGRCGGW